MRKPELSSGGQASSARWVLHKPICISAPAGFIVRGSVQSQWIFFEDSFQCCYSFHDGWFTSALAHTKLSVQQLLTKTTFLNHPALPPQIHPILPQAKVLKGNCFADMEEVKQKNDRNTKRHQNQQVQKLVLSTGKNILIGVLHQMESTLKVTEI